MRSTLILSKDKGLNTPFMKRKMYLSVRYGNFI